MPFGPDSYNALNPTVSSAVKAPSKKADYQDPHAMIIAHDGREIDPSDHLPMESWAPEPEPKGGKQTASSSSRPSPSGPQQPPSGGRRPLRISGRPAYIQPEAEPHTPPSASNNSGGGGRNRLQKKANRASALPAAPPPAGSSPLAPLAGNNYQDPNSSSSGFTPPRQVVRSNTWDYPNENAAPQYGMRGPGGPPVPAKVPIPVMSGALVPVSRGGHGVYNSYGGHGSQAAAGEWGTLAEEIGRIDIGEGRSRRHGGGYNFS